MPSRGLVQLVCFTKHGSCRNPRTTQTSSGWPLVVPRWKNPACTHLERQLTKALRYSHSRLPVLEGHAIATPQRPVFGVAGFRRNGVFGDRRSRNSTAGHRPSVSYSRPDWLRCPRARRPISSRSPPCPGGVVPTTRLRRPFWIWYRWLRPRASSQVVKCGLRLGACRHRECRAFRDPVVSEYAAKHSQSLPVALRPPLRSLSPAHCVAVSG